MSSTYLRVKRPVSFRSKIMLILGVLWVAIGMGVFMDVNNSMAGPPHFLIPNELRAFLWVFTGCLSIYSALVRWHKDEATASLVLMPMLRSASYGWAWLVWLYSQIFHQGDKGTPDAWYFAALHLALVVCVVTVATVPYEIDAEDGDTDNGE